MRKLFTDAGFEVLEIEDSENIRNYCLHAVKQLSQHIIGEISSGMNNDMLRAAKTKCQ